MTAPAEGIVVDEGAARARLHALLLAPPAARPADLRHVARFVIERRQALLRTAEAVETPCYLYDGDGHREALRAFRAAFDPRLAGHRPFYAVKSNPHPTLLAAAIEEGFGLDVASEQELRAALRLPPCPLVFSGPAKSDSDLRLALTVADRITVHLDSLGELRRLGRRAAEAQTPIRAGLRLSTAAQGAWTKFGVPAETLGAAFREAEAYPYLHLEGLQFHLSWNRDPAPYERVIAELGAAIRAQLRPDQRARLRFFDVGGGFRPHQLEGAQPADHPLAAVLQIANEEAGVDTRFTHPALEKPSVPLERYAVAIGAAIEAHVLPHAAVEVWTEPGRVISTPALHILLRVVDRKLDDLVIVDGGINMVGWERYAQIYHPVVNLDHPAETELPVRIGGSLCDCEDTWGARCFASRIEEGDRLLVPFQGAYSLTTAQAFIRPIPPVFSMRSAP
jgi:diaminopimelate decarboxylase